MIIKKIIKKTNLYSKYFQLIKDKKIKKRIQIINDRGIDFIKNIEEVLSDTGLTYFATCGTLLGFIREKSFLKNDYDFDYAIMIYSGKEWDILEQKLMKNGYKKIRYFTFDGIITEQTYKSLNGIEIDFFGHFIIDGNLCFYSYDKLPSLLYKNENEWSIYILNNGKYEGIEKIIINIGEVTVPKNSGTYLSYNYNDDWMIPNPNFKPNTGKGCKLISNKYGVIHNL